MVEMISKSFKKTLFSIINVEKVIVKRGYHIIRIRGILEKYLETGKYDVNLNEVWLNKVFEHKKTGIKS